MSRQAQQLRSARVVQVMTPTRGVVAQFDTLLDAVVDKLPAVAEHLDAASADVLALTA